MTNRVLLSVSAVAVAVAAVLAGCSPTATTTSPPNETPKPASPTSGPTPTSAPSPTPESGMTASVELTDVDGYTMSVDISQNPVSVTADPSSDVPGSTSIVMEQSASIVVVNTTSSRNLDFLRFNGVTSPLDQPGFYLYEGWEAGSLPCQTAKPQSSAGPIEGACSIMVAFGRITSTIPAAGSAKLDVYSGGPNGIGSAGIASVPAANQVDLIAAIENPTFYYLAYWGGDLSRFTNLCPDGGFRGGGNNGFVIVWSSTGQCQPTTQLSQPGAGF